MAKFTGATTKNYSQVLNISPMTGWLSSVLLQKKSSLWSLRSTLTSVRPRRSKNQRRRRTLHLISHLYMCCQSPMATRPQLMLHLGLCFLSCRYYTSTATRERDHVPANSESLLSSYYISLGLGKGKLSFKLTFLKEKEKLRKGFFLIFHGFFSGPPPIQSLSWVFWGAMPLPYPVLFPEFPRLDSSTLSHHFGSNCTCPILLCCHLASTVHGPNKGMSPPAVSLPPVIPDSSPPGRLESSCFCPLWDEVLSVEDTAVPWGFCEAVVS